MRGAGSLQQLLGRSTFTSGKKRRREDANVPAAEAAEDPTPAPPLVESPLKAGYVRCPVCNKQLQQQYGDEYINSHIGTSNAESV